MSRLAKEITTITIEDELKQSYLDYAMSVIVGRALPDVRDGLKPVHRRVLYAMHELSNDWNKPYKKSARIVGDVIGKYHPHGDTAVYDTIVRMAQPFSLRYMLVDGQGNFGSIDGDSPAAMRYTEIRMSQFAHGLLADIDKETVDFTPNYDETEKMPAVLPTRVPNLLVNGSSGIAVGMATNIPPHNLSEVIDATLAVIDNSDITIDALMKYIPGPDFPTAGIINGRGGIVSAYRTGRGKIYVRAKTEIETHEKTGRVAIIVTELPYQVNKARLLEKIGELVRDKLIEGITGLRDESDKSGMRMVIEIRRGDQPEVVLNNLFSQTQLQTVFGINMVALYNGRPQVMDLKFILNAFLQHRREVVTRRTVFELNKAKQRAHILEGLGIALVNIDEIVALIKAAKTPNDAKEALLAKAWAPGVVAALLAKTDAAQTRPDGLGEQYGLRTNKYHLSPEQAQAILDLRLHRLTGLEVDKIHEEYKQLIDAINALLEILSNPDRLHAVIREELNELKTAFGDQRRTVILENHEDLSNEDLITEEDLVVTLSHQGYIKSQSLDSYDAQHRGGRGKRATAVKEEDYVKNLLVANSHHHILCFSTMGKVYWLKTYQIPQASRISRGQPIVNLLPLEKEEVITAILPIQQFDDEHFIFMCTQLGTVKKVALSEFSNQRSNGKIALGLNDGDRLIGVALTDGKQDIMLVNDDGKAIRFSEDQVRAMGRTACGIRGMRLKETQRVIALIIPKPDATILTVTENGFGQRTEINDYRECGRGGQGVIAIQTTDRNGKVVGSVPVQPDSEILLVTNGGTLVRIPVNEISVLGRNTQGVRLIQVQDDEKVVSVESV
ncbi:MAG: DNA gyrase subunit A [Gammaproteobacteria bacterium RIFCSPLOWO2_02_FULL_42_14]|nr:MAG: DNA gyrase subunit A [Gammaproteobacteria bacterium RIFCSPHIGHO2_02_FULL_42_43]OGT52884.1 MAG: DNA gyrase subunit A [Gammaproteobacteria bacterium RIFCSPHIGHO2_12_FULL_41_25]OGT61343.1 MAG: DNA gyrase subunit A [Gammaproteobacteria bacterium RIFCSPLOWO2_02_FULL_42_14]OGT87272.1 MAG: DNA gyrase subunit A [Gammaproteobacteria bacterium RIFCSPLOWO2_12_FULL_42_18]